MRSPWTEWKPITCESSATWNTPLTNATGDFAFAPWNVPFHILERVEWIGETVDGTEIEAPYEPPLRIIAMNPAAPPGMECTFTAHEVRFRSPSFHVGFSLLRPIVTYLAWNSAAGGLVDRSLTRLDSRLARRFNGQWPSDIASGPWYSGLRLEGSCVYWGGEVSVEENSVSYRGLRLIEGLMLDVSFLVLPEGMDIRIRQHVERDLFAPDYEAWRFMWNAEEAITGTLALPISETGRTGVVGVPALRSAPGHGTMLIRQTVGSPVFLQVDSVHDQRFGMSGVLVGVEHDEWGLAVVRAGDSLAELSLRTYELLPRRAQGVRVEDLPEGLRRNWAAAFTFIPSWVDSATTACP